MLSLSLINIMLIFITHFYQHTFDDVDIAIFLNMECINTKNIMYPFEKRRKIAIF